jgi:SAM-dependent methyltransferase
LKAYTAQVYRFVADTSRSSAARIVPLVGRLVAPRSVVDFGCGTGEWLAEFRAAGVARTLGLDGPWVPRGQLAIPEADFRPADLREPVRLAESFDLALCLEVVGHLPKAAEGVLLDSLAAAAPVALFSAPIPLQGGIGGDATNREWPAYWGDRLAERGFEAIDCIRPAVWDDPEVAWWFAQNAFLAARREALLRLPPLAAAAAAAGSGLRALVHPGCFESTVVEAGRIEKRPLREIAALVVRALARRVGRLR